MSPMIGVVCGHGETIALDNPKYSLFFAMLGEQRGQVEPLRDTLTTGALAEYQAALIGGARNTLSADEVQALREWVAAGGSLLVLSSRDPTAPRLFGRKVNRIRGNRRPAETPAPGNGRISAASPGLVDGLTFHRPPGRDIGRVDHSSLTGSPGYLMYHSACALLLDNPDASVTHALPLEAPEGQGQGSVFLRIQQGAGLVLVMGSEAVVNNSNLETRGNLEFLSRLLLLWLPGLVEQEVRFRKQLPQRHRLLHGYPMKPLMWPLARISHRMETGGFLALWSPEPDREEKRDSSRDTTAGDPLTPPLSPSGRGRPVHSFAADDRDAAAHSSLPPRPRGERSAEGRVRGPGGRARREVSEKRLGSHAQTGPRFTPRDDRQLLVGVLPHPFCNPVVKGCGFCTFPHEDYSAQKGGAVVAKVIQEIDGFMQETDRSDPHSSQGWRTRSVKALYFGGGTANLTPAEPFRALCRKLAEVFDLSGAEVTLEGVPAYFVNRRPLLIELLPEETRARHFRISMGLQTFDPDQLRRMGRMGFGTPETFAEVARLGHARGFTVSADLLFNLPGQTLDQMRQDVRRAMDLGLDHIGLYHLVLFDGLGTEWSRDPALLASLPANEAAADHWLTLREMLISNGYDQTTLTNFERVALHGSDRRFLYEESAFRPEDHDMLGFGPGAYSLVAEGPFHQTRRSRPWPLWYDGAAASAAPFYAVKTLNPDSAADYQAAVVAGSGPWESVFLFGRRDMQLLYLTRKIATLGIDRAAYRSCFGSDCVEDFPLEFPALLADNLIEQTADAIRLTPRGMFYADTVAGLLAWQHVRSLRYRQLAADAARRLGRPGQAHLLEFGQYANLFSHMG